MAEPFGRHTGRPSMSTLPILYCLPYAGGDTHVFHLWRTQLADVAEVRPVQLPYRGPLRRLYPCTRMPEMIDHLLATMPLSDQDRPVWLFGHSMGALIAFELARAWQAMGMTSMAHLVVSGHRGPRLISLEERQQRHSLDDAQFMALLRELGGTPPEILANAEIMALYLPILRVDFELCDSYMPQPGPTLRVPITALAGQLDHPHAPEAMAAWRHETQNAFQLTALQGGHFFIHTCQAQVIEALRAALSSTYEKTKLETEAQF